MSSILFKRCKRCGNGDVSINEDAATCIQCSAVLYLTEKPDPAYTWGSTMPEPEAKEYTKNAATHRKNRDQARKASGF